MGLCGVEVVTSTVVHVYYIEQSVPQFICSFFRQSFAGQSVGGRYLNLIVVQIYYGDGVRHVVEVQEISV